MVLQGRIELPYVFIIKFNISVIVMIEITLFFYIAFPVMISVMTKVLG